jgi:hypothetical protein
MHGRIVHSTCVKNLTAQVRLNQLVHQTWTETDWLSISKKNKQNTNDS